MIMNQLLNQYAKHLFVFIGFIVLSLGYFSPVLQGKKIFQSDIVQYTGMAKQHIDFRQDQGKETYWTNMGRYTRPHQYQTALA